MKGKYLDLLLKGAAASPQNDEAGRSADTAKELPPTAGEWTRRGTPDSRSPLIPDSIRSKIEAIEAEARARGWPAELLWNCGFWDLPRGLAAVLEESDEIVEVSADAIIVLKMRRDLLRFPRRTA